MEARLKFFSFLKHFLQKISGNNDVFWILTSSQLLSIRTKALTPLTKASKAHQVRLFQVLGSIRERMLPRANWSFYRTESQTGNSLLTDDQYLLTCFDRFGLGHGNWHLATGLSSCLRPWGILENIGKFRRVHWPMADRPILVNTWKQEESIVKSL